MHAYSSENHHNYIRINSYQLEDQFFQGGGVDYIDNVAFGWWGGLQETKRVLPKMMITNELWMKKTQDLTSTFGCY